MKGVYERQVAGDQYLTLTANDLLLKKSVKLLYTKTYLQNCKDIFFTNMFTPMYATKN